MNIELNDYEGWKRADHWAESEGNRYLRVTIREFNEKDIMVRNVEDAWYIAPKPKFPEEPIIGMVVSYNSYFYGQQVRAVYDGMDRWTIYYKVADGRYASPDTRDFIETDAVGSIKIELEGI